MELKVCVLYYEIGDCWEAIEPGIKKRLPLTDIKWSVSNVDVECKALPIHFEKGTSSQGGKTPIREWHSEPYLNLLLVSCRDKNTYNDDVKEKIRKWVEEKEKEEWLIVYVSFPNDPARQDKFFTIYHYMKKDFNVVKKQERVLQLKLFEEKDKDDDQGWEMFIAKLREGIARHGEIIMEKCIQEIRKLDSERVHPGWNYCKFFSVKEGLALIYETFNMYEESLMQYDELEAVFTAEVELNSNQPFGMKGFGGVDEGDDSGELFKVDKKPYRQMIRENTITEFDFRLYTFARQTHLLFARELPVFVAERGIKFVKLFVKELEKHKFSRIFILMWAFGAFMDLAENCKARGLSNTEKVVANVNTVKARKRQKKDKQQLNFHLSDIYFNACVMLHEIGVLYGFLATDSNFLFGPTPHTILSVPQNPSLPVDKDSDKVNANFKVTNPFLVPALETAESFDKLYLTVTKRAIRAYRECHRQRSINWLQCKIADLHFLRGRYLECAQLLKKVVKSQHNDGEAWPPLLSAAFHKLCECYRQIEFHVDYVATLLALLNYEGSVPLNLREFYFSDLIRVVRGTDTLEKKLAKEALNSLVLVDIVAPPHHLYFALDQPIKIECLMRSCSPLDLHFDSFSMQFIMEEDLELTTDGHRRLILETKDVILHPSTANSPKLVTLELLPTMVGTYVCDKLWISVGKLLLTQSILHAIWEREFRVTITPSKSTLSLDVMAPLTLIFQQTQNLLVTLDTKEDTVRSGLLSVKAPAALFCFSQKSDTVEPLKIKKTKVDKDGSKVVVEELLAKIALTPQGVDILIPDCERKEQLEFLLPVCANGTFSKTYEVTFDLAYSKATTEKFSFKTCMDLHFQHPFKVQQNLSVANKSNENAQDKQRVFVHILLTSICTGAIEITNYELQLNSCPGSQLLNDPNQAIVGSVLHPHEAVSFLFELEKGIDNNPDAFPKMIIKYKLIGESYSPKVSEANSAEPEKGEQDLSFEIKIKYFNSEFEYSVECQHPQKTFKGKRMSLVWKIDQLTQNNNKQKYSVEADKSQWLVVSKHTGFLNFTGDKSNTIECSAIPLSSGILQIPQLNIQNVVDENQNENVPFNKIKQSTSLVTVYPNVQVNSLCEKIEISEKRKQYLFPV